MNESVIIILGASGNLACTKLFPSLYTLFKQRKIPNTAIVGAALQESSIDEILNSAKKYIIDFDEQLFEQFKKLCSYVQVDFFKEDDFARLHEHVQTIEQRRGTAGNRLIYCAVSADFFCPITQFCALSGLAQNADRLSDQWHRIVYEKPFGSDATSARQINECIARYFQENQIYRIDHYLTKELVGNIGIMRFTNCIVEPLWNNRYIENVQIILSEKIGVQGRGAYYDKYGALRDMVQNHMLELVALIGMEAPEKLTGDHIRAARVKVLEKIQVADVLLGQYEGYQQESDVAPDSQTETFAQLCVTIDNPRWAGVPFYLKTGKDLDKKETVIHIKFKQVECLLTKNCPSDSNYLTMQIYPESSFSFVINAKKPGYSNDIEPVKMEFPHHSIFGAAIPESYEVIFEEVIKGEHSVSVRFDEIEAAWQVIDVIEQMRLPVYRYKKGTKGPEESINFEKKHGMRWRS
jgi:glucose-6-phosphate 1-dehydrogenase